MDKRGSRNPESEKRSSRRPDVAWLVRLAKELREAGVLEVELEGVRMTLSSPSAEVESDLLNPEEQAAELVAAMKKNLFAATNRRPTSVKEAHERRTARRSHAAELTS
jgi:hypothetical protein